MTQSPGLGSTGQRAVPAEWNRIGYGTAHGHHGELLQGVFLDRDRLHRGLVTMPCPLFSSQVEAHLTTATRELIVEPRWKTKALRAAETTMRAIGCGPLGGTLKITSNVEVGFGFGSSTSDVTAAIRAVLNALACTLTAAQVARISVLAEVAVDPLMYDQMVLFAHREGRVIEDFNVPMCPFEAVGFALRPEPVDTLELTPARYRPSQIQRLALLRALARKAIVDGDISGIGRIATASAVINQEFLPAPIFPKLLEVIQETGAAGIQVAHSGSIASILFDSDNPHFESGVNQAERHLSRLGVGELWRFGQR